MRTLSVFAILGLIIFFFVCPKKKPVDTESKSETHAVIAHDSTPAEEAIDDSTVDNNKNMKDLSLIKSPNNEAAFRIVNDSRRFLEVKLMQRKGRNADHFLTVTIERKDNTILFIPKSGTYFIKIKGIQNGEEPVFFQGEDFQCSAGESGYSVLSVTIFIEAQGNGNSSLSSIDESEYNKN